MKKTIILFLLNLLITCVFAQNDFEIYSKNKTNTYAIAKIKATDNSSLFGIVRLSDKKIVLPIQYKFIQRFTDNLYAITNTTDEKKGLWSVEKDLFVTPQYVSIGYPNDGLMIVGIKQPNGYAYLYGAIDMAGQTIIPIKYHYLSALSDGLLNFKESVSSTKYGYLTPKNEIFIPESLPTQADFVDGLASMKDTVSGKYGYINKKKEWVIKPQYHLAHAFQDGFAKVYNATKEYSRSKNTNNVMTQNDTIGMIDTRGKLFLPMRYNEINKVFGSNLYAAKAGELTTIMDKNGTIVFPEAKQEIKYFNEKDKAIYVKNSKYGLVSKEGKILIQPVNRYIILENTAYLIQVKNDNNIEILNDDLKPMIKTSATASINVRDDRIFITNGDTLNIYDTHGKSIKNIVQKNLETVTGIYNVKNDSVLIRYTQQISLYDLTAKRVIAIDCENIFDMTEPGIIPIRKFGKYRFINESGKIISDTAYTEITAFGEGVCAAQLSSSGDIFLMDKNFKKIKTLAKTIVVGSFSEGLVAAVRQYLKTDFSYLDKEGNTKFSISANMVYPFKSERAKVKNFSNQYYFINKKGEKAFNEQFEEASDFLNGYALVIRNKKYGIIDTAGHFVVPCTLKSASLFYGGTALIEENEGIFLINTAGKKLNNTPFESASTPTGAIFSVKKNGKWGVVDNAGKTIIPFDYEKTMCFENTDYAWVLKDNKWWLAAKGGKIISKKGYDNVLKSDFDMYTVILDKKVGVIDNKGVEIIPLAYVNAQISSKNTVQLMTAGGSYYVKL